MKTLTQFRILVLAALVLVGCATTSQVQVERIEFEPRPAKSGPVPAFANEDAVPYDYYEYANLRMEGAGGTQNAAQSIFQKEAAKLGADAIIMHPSDRKIQFSGGVQTEQTIYLATAIVADP